MEKALGPNHPPVARALGDMASLYRATGREKAAEGLEKRSETILAIGR